MPVSESEPPKAGQNTREALAVRSAPPPPEGFDPIQATESALRAYGYPARPDIEFHPELHERWNQLMSRPISFIEAEIAVMADRRYSTRDVVTQIDPEQAGIAQTDPNNAWAGSVQYTPADEDPVKFVSGLWTIPRIVRPGPVLAYELVTWVGIDGGPSVGLSPGSADVLQAGTGQGGDLWGTKTFVWFEWFDDAMLITNQLARPGDTMWCSIMVHSPTEGAVFMWNMTTSVATSTIHTATGGKRLTGDTVEWVLETPSFKVNNQYVPGVLAKYGRVYFDQCIAFTKNNKLLEGGKGQMLYQYDVNGQLISDAAPITDQTFLVDYVRTFT